jgi:two-component sensor histidine kinase
MLSHLSSLFSSANYIPHGICLLWEPELMALHAGSDAAIAIAYYSIPFAIIYFVWKRADLVFPSVFILSGAFILACGTTHVMSIVTLWQPNYQLEGIVKLVTALVSLASAFAIWRVMPLALALPGTAQLEQANRSLSQHQRLLNAELDHRVKNILAQVAGIVTSTREGSRSIDDFVQSLEGRIQSMAAAHTLLSDSGWQTVALDTLVRAQLAPYMTSTNVKISGTDVMLSPAETQALGRVLHELATNAAKYGALSIPGGQVSVTWDRKSNGLAATLILEWGELGGPSVASKARLSYGTDLIRNLIPHELGGMVDLAFVKEGVNCWIEFPLKQA